MKKKRRPRKKRANKQKNEANNEKQLNYTNSGMLSQGARIEQEMNNVEQRNVI